MRLSYCNSGMALKVPDGWNEHMELEMEKVKWAVISDLRETSGF
jgi:hypothetical protein